MFVWTKYTNLCRLKTVTTTRHKYVYIFFCEIYKDVNGSVLEILVVVCGRTGKTGTLYCF